ncbi:MAG TPA: polysaccharide deacetylase family protein [Stellaceae bacterium]|nr:polysaccharide deacetylase family protein [Stellaceae bacterium]
MFPRPITRSAHRLVERLIPARRAHAHRDGGVVSFTFDDFPRSALVCGGRILEAHGVRGTFYAAMGLCGGDGESGPLFDAADLRQAHSAGHEIGCHTYGHIDCARARVATVLDDVARNAEELGTELGNGFKPRNFAYPYGRSTLAAGWRTARRFASCRGVAGGINHGSVDLGHLRANRLYAASFDVAAARQLIERNAALGGWLIFYTHDVSPEPSPFGCTPDQFEAVVSRAVERGPVVPVAAALAAVCGDPS